jgi:hypothetical protein
VTERVLGLAQEGVMIARTCISLAALAALALPATAYACTDAGPPFPSAPSAYDAGPGCHLELRAVDGSCPLQDEYVAVCEPARSSMGSSGCSVAVAHRGAPVGLGITTLVVAALASRRRRGRAARSA